MSSGRPWSAEDDTQLRELWGEGLSARRIGHAMKRTKSSIIGRAGRLGVAPRPNPVVRSYAPAKLKPPRPPVELRHPLVRAMAAAVPVAAPKPPPPPPAPPPRAPIAPSLRCQWPEGERHAIRWCDAAAVPGRSYCQEHCRRAYVGFGRSPWPHLALAS